QRGLPAMDPDRPTSDPRAWSLLERHPRSARLCGRLAAHRPTYTAIGRRIRPDRPPAANAPGLASAWTWPLAGAPAPVYYGASAPSNARRPDPSIVRRVGLSNYSWADKRDRK